MNKENDPLQTGIPSGSQAHQLCQRANGRAGWTAGDLNKKMPF